MDVWGLARIRGLDRERYFLLVVDDYTRYTTVFPLRSKGEVPDVLIPWIRAVCLQLREEFRTDLPVLRLHSDRGGEFSSDLLRDFCQGEGILQSFTLPASPQQNGVAERRIGLVIEVARTSMIHAAAPHFLWPFAVRYAAHQLNLWPRVSLPETSPTLRWTGKVGDASVFRVWGARAFVRDTSADKLSSRAIPCVFLGFPPDTPGWQFYHPTSRRPPPVDPLPPHGPAPSGVSQVDPTPLVEPVEVTGDSGAARGAEPGGAEPAGAEHERAEPGGAEPAGAEPGGAEPERAEPGGAEPERAEPGGAEPAGAEPERVEPGGAEPERAKPGGAVPAGVEPGADSLGGAVGTIGAGAASLGNARTGGTGAAGAGGAVGTGDVLVVLALLVLEVLVLEVLEELSCRNSYASGTLRAAVFVVALLGLEALRLETRELEVLERPELVVLRTLELEVLELEALVLEVLELLEALELLPGSPLPAPSPYTEQTDSLTERREPASRPASPVHPVRTGRRVPRQRPPPVPGTHTRTLRPSSVPHRVPLLSPPASSLPHVPDPESDLVRAASPTVTRPLATVITNPSFESAAASALVAELVDFAAACRLDYAASLVAESQSVCPPSVGGECAIGMDVLDDRQEDFECLAAGVPPLVAMLLAPEGD
ncbi:unnamed protein product [Closterium sp. Yama58-4]|nr:unnamed protein product [Closterium sp. Yama58-4]